MAKAALDCSLSMEIGCKPHGWTAFASDLDQSSVNLMIATLQDWSSRSHSTPHEQAIASEFVPVLEAAVQRLEIAPDAATVETDFPPKLRALEEVAQGLMQLVPGPYIELANFSPSLIRVPMEASLPIPGHDRVSIYVHDTCLSTSSLPVDA